MLDASGFTTRSALDNLSIRYANDATDFIAEYLFPTVLVPNSIFKVYHWDTSNFRNVESRTDSKAEANRIDYGVFTRDGNTLLHKLAAEIDPRDQKNADRAVGDLKMDATMNIMDALLIAREREAATKATTSTNYPSDLTSALTDSSNRWTDAGGDPYNDARIARAAVRARARKDANAVAMSQQGFDALKLSPAVTDRIKYTNPNTPAEDLIKNLLGVQYLFIGKAGYNANLEGNATQTITDIWSDNVIFFVYDPTPKQRGISYGKTYMRSALYSHEWQDQARGSGDGRITIVERGWEYVQDAAAVVSSSDGDFAAGYLLRNVY